MRPDAAGGLTMVVDPAETVPVNIDAMTVPVPMIPAPQRDDDVEPHPAEAKATDEHATKIIREVVGRVGGIRPRPVDEIGIVDWNVHHARIGWFDADSPILR
nr:hypothetical protein RSP597_25505 [Ralstonia solanacearum]